MANKKFVDSLKENLLDSEVAAEYLNAAAEQGDPEYLLQVMKDVVDAHGGVGVISQISSVNRQHIYKVLNGEVKPQLDTLMDIARALGLHVGFFSSTKEAA